MSSCIPRTSVSTMSSHGVHLEAQNEFEHLALKIVTMQCASACKSWLESWQK